MANGNNNEILLKFGIDQEELTKLTRAIGTAVGNTLGAALKKALNQDGKGAKDVADSLAEVSAKATKLRADLADNINILARLKKQLADNGVSLVDIERKTQAFDRTILQTSVKLDRLDKALQEGEEDTAKLARAYNRADDALDTLRRTIGKTDPALVAHGIKAQKVDQLFKNFAFSLGLVGYGIGNVGGQMIGFTRSFGNLIEQAATATEPLQRVQNFLALDTTIDPARLKAVVDQIRILSDLPGANLEKVSEAMRVLLPLGGPIEDTLSLVEGLTKATAISGAGAEGVAQLANQLFQFAQSRQLKPADIKAIKERGGKPIISTLEKAFGDVTADTLEAAGPTAVLKALREGLKDIQPPAATTTDQLNRLKNSLIQVGLVFTNILGPALEGFHSFLKNNLEPVVASLGEKFNNLSTAQKNLISSIALGIPILVGALGVLASVFATVAIGIAASGRGLELLRGHIFRITPGVAASAKEISVLAYAGERLSSTFSGITGPLKKVGTDLSFVTDRAKASSQILVTRITADGRKVAESSKSWSQFFKTFLLGDSYVKGLITNGPKFAGFFRIVTTGVSGLFGGVLRLVGLTTPLGILVNLIIAFITDFGRLRSTTVSGLANIYDSISRLITKISEASEEGRGAGRVWNFLVGIVQTGISILEAAVGILGSVFTFALNAGSDLIDLFTNIVDSFSADTFSQVFKRIETSLAVFFANSTNTVKRFIYDIYISLAQAGIRIFRALPGMKAWADQLETNVQGLIEYREGLDKTVKVIDHKTGALAKNTDGLKKNAEAQREVITGGEKLLDRMRQLAQASNSLNLEMDKLIEKQGKGNFNAINNYNAQQAQSSLDTSSSNIKDLVESFKLFASNNASFTAVATAFNQTAAAIDKLSKSALSAKSVFGDNVFVTTLKDSLGGLTKPDGIIDQLRKKQDAKQAMSAEEQALVKLFTDLEASQTEEAATEVLNQISEASSTKVILDAIQLGLRQAQDARKKSIETFKASVAEAKTDILEIKRKRDEEIQKLLSSEDERLRNDAAASNLDSIKNNLSDLEYQLEQGRVSLERYKAERLKLEEQLLRAESTSVVRELEGRLQSQEAQQNTELAALIRRQIENAREQLKLALSRSKVQIGRDITPLAQTLIDNLKSTLLDQAKSLGDYMGSIQGKLVDSLANILNFSRGNLFSKNTAQTVRDGLLDFFAEITKDFINDPRMRAISSEVQSLIVALDQPLTPETLGDIAQFKNRIIRIYEDLLLEPINKDLRENKIERIKLLTTLFSDPREGNLTSGILSTLGKDFDTITEYINKASDKQLDEIYAHIKKSGLDFGSTGLKLDTLTIKNQGLLLQKLKASQSFNKDINNAIDDALLKINTQDLQVDLDKAKEQVAKADADVAAGKYKGTEDFYRNLQRLIIVNELKIQEITEYYNLQKRLNEKLTQDERLRLEAEYLTKIQTLYANANIQLGEAKLPGLNAPGKTPTESAANNPISATDANIKLTDSLSTRIRGLSDSLDKLYSSARSARSEMMGLFDSFADGDNVLDSFSALLNGTGSTMQFFQQIAVTGFVAAVQSISNALIGLLEGNEDLLENLGAFFGTILITIGESLIQMSAAAVAMAFISEFLAKAPLIGGLAALIPAGAAAAAIAPFAALGTAVGAALILAGGAMGGRGSQTPNTVNQNGANAANAATGASGKPLTSYDPNRDPQLQYQKAMLATINIDIRHDDGIIVKKVIKAVNRNGRLGNLISNRNLGFGY